MFFEVHGLKQINEDRQNIQMLVNSNNPGDIRDFFMSKNIVVLSIKKYKLNYNEFGNINGELIDNNNIFPFIIDKKSIQDACAFLLYLGFSIKTINSYKEPLSEQEIQNLIKYVQNEIEQEQKETEQEEIKKKEEIKKIYEDKKLNKIQETVNQILIYVSKFIPKVQDQVDFDKIRELRKNEEILRKLRMGRNSTTIKEVLTKILLLIDELKEEYIKKIGKNGKNIFDGSVISDIDLINEYDDFVKSKLIKKLDIKQSETNQYYIFFDKIGIFLKFIFKDIINHIKNITVRIYNISDIGEFALIIIITGLEIILWSNSFLFFTESLDHFYISMIHLGIFGFLFRITNLIIKPKLKRLIISIILIIIGYFFILKILKLFFAI